jgi:hypothetical protein
MEGYGGSAGSSSCCCAGSGRVAIARRTTTWPTEHLGALDVEIAEHSPNELERPLNRTIPGTWMCRIGDRVSAAPGRSKRLVPRRRM